MRSARWQKRSWRAQHDGIASSEGILHLPSIGWVQLQVALLGAGADCDGGPVAAQGRLGIKKGRELDEGVCRQRAGEWVEED